VTRIFSKRSYEKGVVIVRVEQEVIFSSADANCSCYAHISQTNVHRAVHNFLPHKFPTFLFIIAIVWNAPLVMAGHSVTLSTRVYRLSSHLHSRSQHGCKREDGGTHCLHLISDNLGWFEDNPVNVEM
jgi:hypothetical protein